MPRDIRPTLGQIKRRKAARLPAKQRRKSGSLRLPPGKRTGTPLYENPLAQPVPPTREWTYPRSHFNTRHIEWIHRNERIGEGGFAEVHIGKIKFKGVPKSMRVAIKEIRPAWVKLPDYAELIRRIDQSDARHPKMAYLETNGKKLVLMEPFTTTRGNLRQSKFYPTGAQLFHALRLREPFDQWFASECLEQSARLAKTGIGIELGQGWNGKMIDPFNMIRGKDKQYRVYVQDLDMLRIHPDAQTAWNQTAQSFRTYFKKHREGTANTNRRILTELLTKTAQRHGLQTP